MASQTISADFTTQILLPDDDDILLILKNVKGVVDGTVVNASAVADDRDIEIRGKLTAKDGFECVLLGASANPAGSGGGSIEIGAAASLKSIGGAAIVAFAQNLDITNLGTLEGKFGIRANNANGTIENAGDIFATTHCIVAQGEDLDILNLGLLKSKNDAAVLLEGDDHIFVNQGVIRGPDKGPAILIDTADGENCRVSIQGQLFSDEIAIRGGDGDDKVDIFGVGRVQGDILLGDGQDIFTLRGKLDGVVRGGQDDDIYDLGNKSATIIETRNGGAEDVIGATADIVLPDFVEGAQLLGNKNVDATGNKLANIIDGNFGDNVLRGLDGDDRFFSSTGNDTLFLGKGNDTVQMAAEDESDTLMDFVSGKDVVDLQLRNLNPFTDINDLLFNVQGGCELRIGEDEIFFKGLKENDLTDDDFIL
jgi:hypothetical protein